MTTTSLESGGDIKRREEILRRTLMGIEEDLEDLREELATALVDYEGRLNRTCNDLPEWLVLEPQRLRRNFLFPGDGPFAPSILGPRHAALVASHVEAFVETWLGSTDAPREHLRDDDGSRQRLDESAAELEAFFDQALESTKTLVARARGDLDALLEQIVLDIEDQRETDVDALEALVYEGELEAGRDSQEEIANIWEEQRRRVGAVHARWQVLDDLLVEGERINVETTRELRALFARAVVGLGGAYDALAIAVQIPEIDEEPPPAIEDEDVDLAGDTLPGPTAPELAREVFSIEKTSFEKPKGLEVSAVEGADAPVDAPSLVEPGPVESGPVEDALDEKADEVSLEAPPSSASSKTDDEPEVDRRAVMIALSCPCFRVRNAWVPISVAETAAVLAPPLTVLLGMVAAGIGHLIGNAPNPMREWPWGLPAVGVAMAWIVVLPLVLQWRPSWRGLRPFFVRFGELVDEAELKVEGGRLTMDRTSWALSEVRKFTLARWESPLDETRGWLLDIEAPYHRPIVIATGLTTEEKSWSASELPIVSAPDDAWQASREDFEVLEILAVQPR